jgi:hypothetical protein
MTTKAELENKLDRLHNSRALLIFGIIVGAFAMLQILGFIDDIRIILRLTTKTSCKEILKVGEYTANAGVTLAIFSVVLCFFSQFGSAAALYKIIRQK